MRLHFFPSNILLKNFRSNLAVLYGCYFFFLGCGERHPKEGDASEGNPIFKESSASEGDTSRNLLTDSPAMASGKLVNVVIEIPAGTLEKYELDKIDGSLKLDSLNGEPRIIQYIGYPGNYGMIPKTLLPKTQGGDGDPLDVILLGPPEERGSVIKGKLIGVLRLLDNGEQDDKLIAVSERSPLYPVNDLEEMRIRYPGVDEILQLWFANYKGPEEMQSQGFGGRSEAVEILRKAVAAYESSNN